MVECEHCGEELDTEDAYREHLQLRHGETPAGDDGTSWLDDERTLYLGAPVVAVVLVVAVGVGFTVLGGGGQDAAPADAGPSCPTAATQPHDRGSVHFHGTIGVFVDGEEHELAQFDYFLADESWHLEDARAEGVDVQWHAHARNVSLQYALNTLPGFCAPNASAARVDGTWYRDGGGTTVRYEVNGEAVDPRTYLFEGGDEVRVVVENGAEANLARRVAVA